MRAWAMVALGDANSRMKDFYDVWICSKHLDFNTDTLLRAINATFKNRETLPPSEDFSALTPSFVEKHRVQWNAQLLKPSGRDSSDMENRLMMVGTPSTCPLRLTSVAPAIAI